MKNRLVIVLVLCCLINKNFAQVTDSLQARIVLIGDAGAFVKGKHPVISAVKNNIKLDSKTLILYLGDNLYKEGLPDDQVVGYADAKAVLDTQINVARNTAARVVFIPGNHDWNNGGKLGYEAVLREEQYINLLSNNNVKFYPGGGCPGPTEIAVSTDVTLIVMDSQWWLHETEKPGVESDCPYKTKDEVLVQLEDLLNKNSKKLVILAFHHPLKTYWSHGSYYPIKYHIFPFTEMFPKMYIPLPIIGSIYPITRGIFGTIQDLKHPVYQDMISSVQKVVKSHPNVIYASGHEHSLQHIKDSNYNYLVVGSGCKETRISKKAKVSQFASPHLGFATLEISNNKNVDLAFYTVNDSGQTEKPYTASLMNFSALPVSPTDTVTSATVVKSEPWKEKVTAAPNTKFEEAKGLKRKVLGDNYRKDWATPVELKVFDISQ